MSNITVNSKDKFPESIGGRSIFIDDIENDAELELEFIFDNGARERHVIVSGSKFSSPDAIIDDVVFYNKAAVDVDVQYHFSLFLIYDEAKVIGDVKSLTRFDNLTPDNNRYMGGAFRAATAGFKSGVCLSNPAGSGQILYVSNVKVSSLSGVITFSRESNLAGYVDLTTNMPLSHNKTEGQPNGVGKIYSGATFATFTAVTDIMTNVPTDTVGNATPFDFKNSPIEIKPGGAFHLLSHVVNSQVSGSFDWWEELQ